MASINLVVEQVNHKADDIEEYSAGVKTSHIEMDHAFNTVVDAHTDFLRRTPAVNDGLSDGEDQIEEDRPSSTDTVTETEPIDSLGNEDETNSRKAEIELPSVHKESHLKIETTQPSRMAPVHNDEGISDMTYPQISYPVAQYLFETNPGLTEKMEQILVSGGSSQSTTPSQSTNASPLHRKSSKSSLASLACMTDALGLQQSTIGNAKIPAATPEQVVDAINKIQADRKLAEKRYQKVHSSTKMEGNNGTSRKTANGDIRAKNLVPYPPERITKVVEKSSSWFGSSQQDDERSSLEDASGRRQSSGTIQNVYSSDAISNSVDSGYSPQIEERMRGSQRLFGNHENDNFSSLHNESYSDRMETASNISNYSERLEIMSNISGVSGFEEEMFRIRKLLIESPPNEAKFYSDLQQKHSLAVEKSELQQNSIAVSSPKKKNEQVNYEAKSVGPDQSLASKENEEVVFRFQREIANLEGQIEVMHGEMESTVEEKARMQATMASLQTQLKTQITSTQNAIQEKEMAEQEVEKVVKSGKDWNNTIKELQSQIDQQAIEAKLLKDELDEMETEKARLRVTVEEVKVDLDTREGVVEGLKKKIAELHVELQTMHQTNIQIKNDQSSMQSDVAALNKSKSWYQQQLHSVQEERGQLQQHLMESQTQTMKYCNEVEKLKCETIQLRQQLNETQHRAMREKEILMHHLETIEADILEREMTFEQLQKEKGNFEEGLSEKLKKMEEDKSKLNNLMFNVSDLTNQLDSAKTDLHARDVTIFSLENDKVRILKDAALKEKDFNAKNLSLKQHENQLREMDLKVRQLQNDLSAKDEQYSNLKTEKTKMEVALVSANNEKKEITDALASLRMNLSKVESNFKQMKAEVVRKSSELEKTQREKDRLQTNVEQLEQTSTTQRQEFESQVCMDSQQRGLIISDLKRQKTELEKVLHVLRVDLHKTQSDSCKLEQRNNELEQQLKEISGRWNEMNNTLQNVIEEKQFLEGRLQAREKQTLIKSPNVDNDLYKNRAKDLQQTLENCQADFREKQRVYKSNIKVLMKKLRQLREKAETEMKLRIEAEKLEIMNGDLGDTNEIQVLNDRLTQEVEDYKLKLSQVEENLEGMTAKYNQQKQIAEENHKLALALEKEKGRLAGVTQNHSALKQHTSHLEATLAQRESVVSELDHISKEIAEKQRYDEAKLHEKILSLEDALHKERNTIKELRKQLFQDKRENSNLKRHMKTMKEGLEGANQHGDLKKMEILKLKSELDLKIQAELKHRSEIEAMHTELKKTKAEVERNSRALEESNARDPVLTQQMKTLTWHLKQKNEELVGLKEQLRLLQETHNSELKATKSLLQNTEAVGEQLRMELAQVRKEKFGYQGKVNDLRTALKTSVEHNKKIINKFNELHESSTASLSSSLNLPESPTCYDDSYVNQLLEQSISLPQTRPLSNLKTCLNALKTEVGELMKQLHVEESSTEVANVNSAKSISNSHGQLQSNGIQNV